MEVYYPAAIQVPGPAGKTYGVTNSLEGAIMHSMQGSWAGAATVLYDESVSNTNAYRAACWHFSILKDGTVYQHYALDATPFHAGNRLNNRRLVGVEHEGGPPGNLSEPLTEPQVVAGVALLRWMAAQAGWPDLQRNVRLLEHNEVYGTACPSGRIPWERYTKLASGLTVATSPLPGGEFLPEPDLSDAAAFYRAIALKNQPDVEVIPIPPERAGWDYWKVGVKR